MTSIKVPRSIRTESLAIKVVLSLFDVMSRVIVARPLGSRPIPGSGLCPIIGVTLLVVDLVGLVLELERLIRNRRPLVILLC